MSFRHNNDGVPQIGVNGPRFSTSIITRRAPSFKRNNAGNTRTAQHEINVNLNSPRSDSTLNSVSSGGFDAFIEKKQTHNKSGLFNRRLMDNKRNVIGGSNAVRAVFELGFRERKRLGPWIFVLLCGLCVLLGAFNVCFNGFVGSVAIHGADSTQQVHAGSPIIHHSRTQPSSRAYGHGEGVDVRQEDSDLEQTFMMVASGLVDHQNSIAKLSDLRTKPSSENFTQCINLSQHHKRLDEKTNGYILINTNGGLNEMRFGNADL